MNTVQKLESAGAVVAYHQDAFQAAEKSLDTPEAEKVPSAWAGKLADKLGLKGPVREADFAKIMQGDVAGQHIARVRAGGAEQHVAGFDMVCSPDKSVSVAALVLDRRDVEAAHGVAVGKALEYLEQNGANYRVSQGRSKVRTPSEHGLCAAKFTHYTSRAGDPQLHTHVVVANVAYDAKAEKYRALEGRSLMHAVKGAEQAYNKSLHENLQMLGYKSELAEGMRSPRIAGFTPEQLAGFSARAGQKDEQLAAWGIDPEHATYAQSKAAVLASREDKTMEGRDELQAAWRAKAEAMGIDKHMFHEQGNGREAPQDKGERVEHGESKGGPGVGAAPGNDCEGPPPGAGTQSEGAEPRSQATTSRRHDASPNEKLHDALAAAVEKMQMAQEHAAGMRERRDALIASGKQLGKNDASKLFAMDKRTSMSEKALHADLRKATGYIMADAEIKTAIGEMVEAGVLHVRDGKFSVEAPEQAENRIQGDIAARHKSGDTQRALTAQTRDSQRAAVALQNKAAQKEKQAAWFKAKGIKRQSAVIKTMKTTGYYLRSMRHRPVYTASKITANVAAYGVGKALKAAEYGAGKLGNVLIAPSVSTLLGGGAFIVRMGMKMPGALESVRAQHKIIGAENLGKTRVLVKAVQLAYARDKAIWGMPAATKRGADGGLLVRKHGKASHAVAAVLGHKLEPQYTRAGMDLRMIDALKQGGKGAAKMLARPPKLERTTTQRLGTLTKIGMVLMPGAMEKALGVKDMTEALQKHLTDPGDVKNRMELRAEMLEKLQHKQSLLTESGDKTKAAQATKVGQELDKLLKSQRADAKLLALDEKLDKTKGGLLLNVKNEALRGVLADELVKLAKNGEPDAYYKLAEQVQTPGFVRTLEAKGQHAAAEALKGNGLETAAAIVADRNGTGGFGRQTELLVHGKAWGEASKENRMIGDAAIAMYTGRTTDAVKAARRDTALDGDKEKLAQYKNLAAKKLEDMREKVREPAVAPVREAAKAAAKEPAKAQWPRDSVPSSATENRLTRKFENGVKDLSMAKAKSKSQGKDKEQGLSR